MAIEKKPTGDNRGAIVLAAGGATTLVAFALVFALAKSGTNIMGWYANWILPAGAILVGVIAASGYAIATWFTGLKMTTRFAWSVVGQLVLSYFIAQYESFQLHVPTGSDMGFWEWFDLSTRAFSFSSRNGQPGDPMGAAGYIFRVLEVAGFVGGGVIVPLGMGTKPYCDACRVYKRTSPIALIPGGMQPPEMIDGPYGDRGQSWMLEIYKAAHDGDRKAMERLIDDHGSLARKRETTKHDVFIRMTLTRCPRCAQGELASTVTQHDHGKNVTLTPIGGVELPGERVRQLFDQVGR